MIDKKPQENIVQNFEVQGGTHQVRELEMTDSQKEADRAEEPQQLGVCLLVLQLTRRPLSS